MALTTRATISSIVALSSGSIKRAESDRARAAMVETANLIADCHASCLVSAHHDRQASVSCRGDAGREWHGDANAQRIDLARRDYDEAMSILHFPSGDRVRINPVDVATAGDVAPNHQLTSRPMGSPSCAQATSALKRFIAAWPFSSSANEYRLRAELAGSATSFRALLRA
jgi:hypothetical protein